GRPRKHLRPDCSCVTLDPESSRRRARGVITMRKREFLGALLLPAAAAPLPAWAAYAPRSSPPSSSLPPTLLTITGDIGRTNRGHIDKELAVLMSKYGLSFDKAFNFDFPMLA